MGKHHSPLSERDRARLDRIMRPAAALAPLIQALTDYVESEEFARLVRAKIRAELASIEQHGQQEKRL